MVQAKFGMALETGKIIFNIYDSVFTKYGLTCMPQKKITWGSFCSKVESYVVCMLVQYCNCPQYDDHLAFISFQLYALKWNLCFHDIADTYGIGIDIIVSVQLFSASFC